MTFDELKRFIQTHTEWIVSIRCDVAWTEGEPFNIDNMRDIISVTYKMGGIRFRYIKSSGEGYRLLRYFNGSWVRSQV